MLCVSGFNGFNQLAGMLELFSRESNENKQIKHKAKLNLNSVKEFFTVSDRCYENLAVQPQIVFSWSFCVVFSGNSLWMCGFVSKTEDLIQRVQSPNGCNICQICCNRTQVVCVLEDGGCWLYNTEEREWKNITKILNTEQTEGGDVSKFVRKVCCGETVTVALTNRGEVYNIPNKIIIPGVKIVDVACGRSHILMLSERGEVFSVGEGSRGQLGHGELEDEEEPRLVEGLAGLKVVTIACGGWHSCALTADGDLYSWGWNMAGQLGLIDKDSTNKVSVQAVPRVVDWPDGQDVQVTKVACGTRHTLALLDDSSVWGCGWNAYGQLALPEMESTDRMTKLPAPSDITRDILCGHWNSCLIT